MRYIVLFWLLIYLIAALLFAHCQMDNGHTWPVSVVEPIPDSMVAYESLDTVETLQPVTAANIDTLAAVDCDSLITYPEYMFSIGIDYNLPGYDSISAGVVSYGINVRIPVNKIDSTLQSIIGYESSIERNNINLQTGQISYFISLENPANEYLENTYDRPGVDFYLWSGGQIKKLVKTNFWDLALRPTATMGYLDILGIIQNHRGHRSLYLEDTQLTESQYRAIKNYYVANCITGDLMNLYGLGLDSSFYFDFVDVLQWGDCRL